MKYQAELKEEVMEMLRPIQAKEEVMEMVRQPVNGTGMIRTLKDGVINREELQNPIIGVM